MDILKKFCKFVWLLFLALVGIWFIIGFVAIGYHSIISNI